MSIYDVNQSYVHERYDERMFVSKGIIDTYWDQTGSYRP